MLKNKTKIFCFGQKASEMGSRFTEYAFCSENESIQSKISTINVFI